MSDKGYTHFYFGDGKGKTTAALGLALRAAGHGKKVVIVHFLKNWECGELASLALIPNVTVFRGKPGATTFVRDMSDAEIAETKASHDSHLRKALDMASAAQCDLLVLDEAIDAFELGVLDEDLLMHLLENKPPALELVITGHSRNDRMIENSDYVTEMAKIRHPFDKGVKARKGIEF